MLCESIIHQIALLLFVLSSALKQVADVSSCTVCRAVLAHVTAISTLTIVLLIVPNKSISYRRED
jgi:hypothetical protein